MTEVSGVEIRTLGEADLAAAMGLKESAGWNQTEADWLRLLRLEPAGCFAADAGGRLVGTATTTAYGRELAWVGMVLVDSEFRRRGIASLLMDAALSYLDGRGIETVKLDATPDGRHVYERLGFETESLVERWHCRCVGEARAGQPVGGGQGVASRRVFDGARLAEVVELDRAAFGADRSRLVRLLAAESTGTFVRTGSDGRALAYALAREGAVADYVGPVVATDLETAAGLIDDALARLASRPIYIDVNTQFESATRALAERGFSKQRELIRMRRGAKSGAGTSPRVFAIAGPEVG